MQFLGVHTAVFVLRYPPTPQVTCSFFADGMFFSTRRAHMGRAAVCELQVQGTGITGTVSFCTDFRTRRLWTRLDEELGMDFAA